jgi:hypothetical protein
MEDQQIAVIIELKKQEMAYLEAIIDRLDHLNDMLQRVFSTM